MQFPTLFEQRMRDLLGDEWSAFADAFAADAPARGLRINPLKTTPKEALALLGEEVTPTPFSPWGFHLTTDRKAGNDPLHHAGVYYRQEPSAMSAVTALAPQRGERVLDLCAAPGGKSTQIAASLAGEGLLWCNEYVRSRATPLMQNLERCGVRNAVVTSLDTAVLAEHLPEAFDAVLCDAPCSGEGMFRKEPEALAQWSMDNIELCAARQRTILEAAAKTVRPGGRLLYSTCTFAPEENEQNAAWFLATHPDFEAGDLSALPFGRPAFPVADFPVSAGRRILPQHGGEGHFLALFHRKGDGEASPSPYVPPKKDAYAAEAEQLYRTVFRDEPHGTFVTVGDTVRLLPPAMPATALHLLYAGVAVADVCKDRLEPAHSIFAAKRAEDCRAVVTLTPDAPALSAFLHGEAIPCDDTLSGWTAVAVGNAVVGFGKAVNGTLKNRYPKGLRI
ncbi:MAG: hypothetical protein E7549_05030 [Ruminococcaceae bacterium]|nr:hypothetical protein [Oscillospiraceae bacterium]